MPERVVWRWGLFSDGLQRLVRCPRRRHGELPTECDVVYGQLRHLRWQRYGVQLFGRRGPLHKHLRHV